MVRNLYQVCFKYSQILTRGPPDNPGNSRWRYPHCVEEATEARVRCRADIQTQKRWAWSPLFRTPRGSRCCPEMAQSMADIWACGFAYRKKENPKSGPEGGHAVLQILLSITLSVSTTAANCGENPPGSATLSTCQGNAEAGTWRGLPVVWSPSFWSSIAPDLLPR